MFQVNRSENRLRKLEEKRFADLQLREREHLQEWLANQPDTLGEELLIIQKEFDGFADTRERLDLLALDKDGHLVVIENKLDDSGRDVAWQALKYTAYVSSLTKAQIIDIYQHYLDRFCGGGNAVQSICDFLEVDELDEVVLNPGNDQRLMFIAANFRKEVTSTVLWLREHRIDARCFKVVPYGFGEELFVDIQQVIPTPEAADFMIGMTEKTAEEKNWHDTMRQRQRFHEVYWNRVIGHLNTKDATKYKDLSSSRNHWLSIPSPLENTHFSLVLQKRHIRAELFLAWPTREETELVFNRFCARQAEIEGKFGQLLEWIKPEKKRTARIQLSKSSDPYSDEVVDEIADWLVNTYCELETALRGALNEISESRLSAEYGES
ncbi:DUF4268 domain-containing protein [Roseibium suaedae]|uniref:DUF4268 domain-containing protein n=1 Tax=Roseibium suaedae TaxID=735517 RepID=A0A1M7KL16_9HYPH|nr:DUF4268 domain-containing protein [Roseibium suaedae]SHM66141.1 protein of unknown function [Roseibium suaedae]